MLLFFIFFRVFVCTYVASVCAEIKYVSVSYPLSSGLFLQSDIVHQSVYELVHSEDREELQRQLMWNSAIPTEPGSPSPSITLHEALHPDNGRLLQRSFTIRFRCLLDNTSGFLVK